MNPYKIAIEHPELGDELEQAVRAVEHRYNASEAYDTAFECSCSAGLGWLLVGVYDEKGRAKVRVTSPRNPCSVYIDPWSQQIDGSDAEWAVVVGYLNKKRAIREYGEEIDGSIDGLDCYSSFAVPSDSIAEVLLYTRKDDGFEVTKFVGQKPVETSFIADCPYVPVVPVYGDFVDMENSTLHVAGIVRKVRDAQRMVNFYASNEAELAALAPRSPFVAAFGQTEGAENDWATANSKAHDVLKYNPISVAGVLVPRPDRVDNTAQTAPLIASKTDSIAMFSRLTGMGDHMWGSGQSESGISRIVAQSMGEIATAQYTDNLAKSIRQVGRIILRLIKIAGEATVDAVGADGEMIKVEIPWDRIDLDDVHVSVDAGPAYESRKREGTKAIIEVMGLLDPAQKALSADILTEALDAPGAKELTRRLRKLLPPEITEDEATAPDPQAIQALQEAEHTILQQQETIDQLEGVMRQMQSAIIDNAKDRQVDLMQSMIDARVKLAVEAMKQEGANQRTAAEIASKAEGEMFKAVAELDLDEPDVVPGQVAPMVVGPQSIDDGQVLQALAAIEAATQSGGQSASQGAG
jgi:hypothetical protein